MLKARAATKDGKPATGGLSCYITPAGIEAMRRELNALLRDERPKIVEIVSWAAGNGDRSENGDYQYGKRRLREIDRRIRFLTKRIDNAIIVDPAAQPRRDRVFFGAQVLYCDELGEEFRITIVGVDEAEPLQGKISWISPVARALLKAQEGETVTLRTPSGVKQLEVLEIIYPDE